MRIGSLALSLIFPVISSGCASVNFTAPEKHSFEKQKTYSIPFEKAWIRSVDWFADHNISIDKIEKESGLLTAKYSISVNQNYLDCGKYTHSGLLKEPLLNRIGTLNVTIRELSPSTSRVNVNFFGEYLLTGNDSWDGRSIVLKGACESTGFLEKSILNFISTEK